MSTKSKYPYTDKCRNCGKQYARRNYADNHCSWQCSMEYMTQNIVQMHNKSGPMYDKWKVRYLAGMRNALDRMDADQG